MPMVAHCATLRRAVPASPFVDRRRIAPPPVLLTASVHVASARKNARLSFNG